MQIKRLRYRSYRKTTVSSVGRKRIRLLRNEIHLRIETSKRGDRFRTHETIRGYEINLAINQNAGRIIRDGR